MEVEFARRSKYLNLTANTTLTRIQSNSVVTNIGASGTTTHVLPQDAEAGDVFVFKRVAAQAIRIDPGARGAVYAEIDDTFGKQADDKYVELDSDGAAIELVADGNGDWVAIWQSGTVDVES